MYYIRIQVSVLGIALILADVIDCVLHGYQGPIRGYQDRGYFGKKLKGNRIFWGKLMGCGILNKRFWDMEHTVKTSVEAAPFC